MSRSTRFSACTLLLALLTFTTTANADPPVHTLTMFPAEHKVIEDPKTGATLTFLTTDPGSDTNLYFHEYAWTADGSIILFYSGRENGGLMGYLTATGELFTFRDTAGSLGGATAALTGNGLYALRDASIIRLDFEVAISEDPAATPSVVRAREHHIAALPKAERFTALGENCAGTTLAVGVQDGEIGPVPAILTIDVASGEVRELCRAPESPSVVQHVQWSHTDPHVLSYRRPEAAPDGGGHAGRPPEGRVSGVGRRAGDP